MKINENSINVHDKNQLSLYFRSIISNTADGMFHIIKDKVFNLGFVTK